MEKAAQISMEFITFANLIRRAMDANGTHQCAYGDASNAKFILYLLRHKNQDVFQKDLEEAFSLRPSTVSRGLKSLEAHGYIKRSSVAYDARLKKVELTEKSLKMSRSFEEELLRICEKMMHNISEDEIESFLGTMKKMKINLEK